MSLWSRITNLFRGDSPSREIDEELQSHIADAIESRPRSRRSPARIRLSACAIANRAATSA